MKKFLEFIFYDKDEDKEYFVNGQIDYKQKCINLPFLNFLALLKDFDEDFVTIDNQTGGYGYEDDNDDNYSNDDESDPIIGGGVLEGGRGCLKSMVQVIQMFLLVHQPRQSHLCATSALRTSIVTVPSA